MPQTPARVGEDPAAIALAARAVLLSEASKTCHLGSCSEDQERLLEMLTVTTDMKLVRGQSFPDFLESANRRLDWHARDLMLDATVTQTLRDLAAAEPSDVIGRVYDRLVRLGSEAYGRQLDPALSVKVMPGKSAERPASVRGKVRRRDNEIELVTYLGGFDLTALALIPRILAHELVCHVAANHTDVWSDLPDPDVRDYFADGFMDRASWLLLLGWVHSEAFPRITPVGHLSVRELEYTCEKPRAFKAGIVAFDNCVAKTAEWVRRPTHTAIDMVGVRAESEGLSIRTALRLNASNLDIKDKDWFAYRVRDPELAAPFALVAAEGGDPLALFESGAELSSGG